MNQRALMLVLTWLAWSACGLSYAGGGNGYSVNVSAATVSGADSDEGGDEQPTLPGLLATVSEMKNQIAAEIGIIEARIRQNDATIQKSRRIIEMASMRGDATAKKAEATAREALARAEEARRKNEENKAYSMAQLGYLDGLIDRLREAERLSSAGNDTNSSTCDCEVLRNRYEGFKKAIRNFSGSARMSTEEYAQWEGEMKEASMEGLQALLDGVTFGVARALDMREVHLAGMEREMEKYGKGLPGGAGEKYRYLLKRFEDKRRKAERHYQETSRAVRKLKSVDAVSSMMDLFRYCSDAVELIDIELRKGDTQIMDLLKDPDIRSLSGEIAVDFANHVLEYEATIRKTDKVVGPALGRLNVVMNGFMVAMDSAYAARHLQLSIDRLKELGEVGEKNFQAMQALIHHQKDIEARLRSCRCEYRP